MPMVFSARAFFTMTVLPASFLTIFKRLNALYALLRGRWQHWGKLATHRGRRHGMSIFDIALDHELERIQQRNPYKLSPRELEVAVLIGQGLTSREAGEKLAISYKTVETHRAHIMTKVGARNSAHLAYIIGTLARSQTARPDIV